MSNDDARDDYLVGRLALGDNAALAELCARYRRSVVSYFRERTYMRLDFEHLAGVVFDKVARAAASYEPRGRFKGWLFSIARNVLKDELRRDARQRARDGLWHVTKRGSAGTQTRNIASAGLRGVPGTPYNYRGEVVDVSFHTRGVDVSVRLRPGELERRGYSPWAEIRRMFRRFGLVDGPTEELNRKSMVKINDSKSAFGGVMPTREPSLNGAAPPAVCDRITCQVCARPSKCNQIGAAYVCGRCEREAACNWSVARQLQILNTP